MEEPARKPSRLRKWGLRALVALAVLLAGAWLLRNVLVRKGLEVAVAEATGFPLSVGSLDLGLFRTRVEVGDLRLSNPGGFEDPRCLRAPRLVADVDVGSLFTDSFHAEEIVLDVAEVVVVKNARGETNLDRLAALGDGGKGDPAGDGRRGKGKPRKWRCDRLHLKVGKVVLLDYSKAKGGKPREDSWDLGIDETFRDIDGPGKIARLLVLRILEKAPLRLVNVSAASLREGLGGVVDAAGRLLGGSGKGVGGIVEGVGGALEGILGGGEGKGEGEGKPPPPPPGKGKR